MSFPQVDISCKTKTQRPKEEQRMLPTKNSAGNLEVVLFFGQRIHPSFSACPLFFVRCQRPVSGGLLGGGHGILRRADSESVNDASMQRWAFLLVVIHGVIIYNSYNWPYNINKCILNGVSCYFTPIKLLLYQPYLQVVVGAPPCGTAWFSFCLHDMHLVNLYGKCLLVNIPPNPWMVWKNLSQTKGTQCFVKGNPSKI